MTTLPVIWNTSTLNDVWCMFSLHNLVHSSVANSMFIVDPVEWGAVSSGTLHSRSDCLDSQRKNATCKELNDMCGAVYSMAWNQTICLLAPTRCFHLFLIWNYFTYFTFQFSDKQLVFSCFNAWPAICIQLANVAVEQQSGGEDSPPSHYLEKTKTGKQCKHPSTAHTCTW